MYFSCIQFVHLSLSIVLIVWGLLLMGGQEVQHNWKGKCHPQNISFMIYHQYMNNDHWSETNWFQSWWSVIISTIIIIIIMSTIIIIILITMISIMMIIIVIMIICLEVSSIFFIGCGFGSLVTPPLAGNQNYLLITIIRSVQFLYHKINTISLLQNQYNFYIINIFYIPTFDMSMYQAIWKSLFFGESILQATFLPPWELCQSYR